MPLSFSSDLLAMRKTVIAVGSTRKPKLAAVSEAVRQFAAVLAPGQLIDFAGFAINLIEETLLRGRPAD